jgi:mono/diheme cytochrome c family protein
MEQVIEMKWLVVIVRKWEARLLKKLECYVAAPRARQVTNRAALLLLSSLAVGLFTAPAARADDAIYTEAQAKQGEHQYSEHCAGCHGMKLQGQGKIPALSGPAFLKAEASGQSLDDLFFVMRSFMPYDAPGKLSKQQYVEIMAYILKMNGFFANDAGLSTNARPVKKDRPS